MHDDTVKKITGAADQPAQIIRRYKNEQLPKVAVTVDLLTTGVDVPEIVNLVQFAEVDFRNQIKDASLLKVPYMAVVGKREAEAGNQVAVVVSAMAGETDRLVNFCREASPLYDPAEYDVVVASGESIVLGGLIREASDMQRIGKEAPGAKPKDGGAGRAGKAKE